MIRARALGLALGVALGLAGAFAAGPVAADPLLPARAMTPTLQRSLTAEFRADRAVHPQAWRAVSDLSTLRPEVYRATRIGRPAVTRELRSLGPDALLPMLDALAVSGYPRTLSTEEREALTVGLLEAVGFLRDRRAAPVLRAAFAQESAPDTLRAAARGLAALDDNESWEVLRAATEGDTERASIALSALGTSPRAAATPLLLGRLGDTSPAVVSAAAHALSERHGTWAAAARRVQDPQRPAVAAALVDAYARATDRGAQEALQTAVLALGAQESPALAEAAARAPGADSARLQRLARMARRAAQ